MVAQKCRASSKPQAHHIDTRTTPHYFSRFRHHTTFQKVAWRGYGVVCLVFRRRLAIVGRRSFELSYTLYTQTSGVVMIDRLLLSAADERYRSARDVVMTRARCRTCRRTSARDLAMPGMSPVATTRLPTTATSCGARPNCTSKSYRK